VSSVRYYTDLLDSMDRLRGMRRGIEAAVRPGDRVLEIGTGLGTFAFWAANAGAAEVVAVDRAPIVHLAESMAQANGTADRIRFLRGRFPEVLETQDVAGPFDVVIFEDLAGLGVDPERAEILRAAADLAAPGARLLPARIRICAVPVTSSELGERLLPSLEGAEELGLDAGLLRDFLRHEALRTEVGARWHVGTPARTAPIELHPLPPAGDLRVSGRWTPDADTTIHAIVTWFDLEVAPDEWVSNGPEGEPQPWAQYAYPVDPPLELPAGTEVAVEIGPGGEAGDPPGPWRWRVTAGSESRSGDELAGRPFGPPDLGSQQPDA